MTTEAGKQEILIPKNLAVPLIEQLSIVRGRLSQALELPVPADGNAARDALAWWKGQKKEDQPLIHTALEALAAPVLIADCTILSRNSIQIFLRMLVFSLRPEDPVFLVGNDPAGKELRVEFLRHRDIFINTLLLHLAGTSPVLSDGRLAFSIPRQDLPVLLGIIDLRRRQRYQSLMGHKPLNSIMNFQEIEQSTGDGIITKDPRWILPFTASILPVRFTPLKPQDIRQSLTGLITKELVREGPSPGTYDMTEAGQMLAGAWGDQITGIGFSQVGARDDGKFAAECAMAIRSESSLWFADLGGTGTIPVAVTTATFTEMRDFLEKLFNPAGIAQIPGTSAGQDSGSRAVHGKKTPPPSRPVTYTPPATVRPARAFCSRCGSPITPGRPFCGDCGESLQ
jgi:hypothetical protein